MADDIIIHVISFIEIRDRRVKNIEFTVLRVLDKKQTTFWILICVKRERNE